MKPNVTHAITYIELQVTPCTKKLELELL